MGHFIFSNIMFITLKREIICQFKLFLLSISITQAACGTLLVALALSMR